MAGESQEKLSPPSFLGLLGRKDVLAGLMFIGVSVLGLWASRNYSIGTATRMGTGYVPRLLSRRPCSITRTPRPSRIQHSSRGT